VKILIVSDLHGNLEAASTLPLDYDEMWVLGDLVHYGPNPREIIDFVRANAALVVRGNHDHAAGWQVDPRCSPRFRRMAEETQRYTASLLTPADREYLQGLPVRISRRAGGTRFLAFHATPDDPLYEYAGPDSLLWEEALRRQSADVLLSGHTHLQFGRKCGGGLVMNPGSVGQSKGGAPRACYAVWRDGELRLESVEYDFETTIAKIGALPLTAPVREDLSVVLRTGSSTSLLSRPASGQ
jgi:protein phosphatase